MNQQSKKDEKGSLKTLIALCIMAFFISLTLGCVQAELSADKTEVAPGEEVLLTTTCTPPDPGDYLYLWVLAKKPLESNVEFLFWGSSQEIFIPDVIGEYVIDCKAGGGSAQGIDFASITILCTGNASWTVEPTELDFGYVQTDKKVNVENTGAVPINVSIDDSSTADWVTDITVPGNIDPEENKEIWVSVSREGLDPGEYNTSFVVHSDECGDVTINITMMVGPAKILFSVDTSGSMAWTDPDDKRVEAVLETINKFYDNPRVSFGIIDFDSTAQLLTDFTRDMAVLNDCANALGDDNGWTTYLGSRCYYPGALDVIDDVIDGTEVGTHFVTIFLSDGEPTTGNCNHDDIVAKVADIASPDNVKLYTIYLNGDPNGDAEALLNDMAIAGGTEETHVYTDPDSLSFIDLDF
ncbi:MAG: VWA domain-containing protein [Thermodesulfobacteriota bacterium]|nr:VWA domain-containing protein [Thermodesulfobacteriota bacterium]